MISPVYLAQRLTTSVIHERAARLALMTGSIIGSENSTFGNRTAAVALSISTFFAGGSVKLPSKSAAIDTDGVEDGRFRAMGQGS